ncbi:RNA polymerase sigma factor FliA [Denitratisoma oestradiolicum]|uniref:RNA polymerase sigma factor FliA n=1 Tax=Denitratisoma oestradiolicum TaxID=311182 RepID=A0A6S6XZM9_9PROT|nr:RNA polymerase sigma factor FliA [Denitratisoma oestradiolicum]TWO81608.1 RNA polymerase sigma factor FliA [Denitratisoma oestradiolicum]CAB1370548.1 RNA polymerase sigma factor FliA [Denitratisoma oestradiolicum]
MYTAQGALEREQLVRQYAPLVKRIAYHLMARLPASVQAEDLIQNGMLGLLDALTRFEDGQGAQFETYAVQRIRGAMLDGLRENDWLPRGVRREMRRVEVAIQKLEHHHGRPPSEGELAEALGLALDDYQKLLQEARGHQLLYLEDMGGDRGEGYLERNVASDTVDPLRALEDADMRAALVSAIAALPEREKLMMALYYEQDLNLREIGEVMGVTESRVCQIHTQAVARLRVAVMGEYPPQPKAKRGSKPKGAPA